MLRISRTILRTTLCTATQEKRRVVERQARTRRPAGVDGAGVADSWLSSVRRRRRDLCSRHPENPEPQSLSSERRILCGTRRAHALSEPDCRLGTGQSPAAAVGVVPVAPCCHLLFLAATLLPGSDFFRGRASTMGSSRVDGRALHPTRGRNRSLHLRSVSESPEPGRVRGCLFAIADRLLRPQISEAWCSGSCLPRPCIPLMAALPSCFVCG